VIRPDIDWFDSFDLPGVREQLDSLGDQLLSIEVINPIQVFAWDMEHGLLSCDRLLMGFPTGNQQSFGTGAEWGAAYAFGIPAVAWIPDMTGDRKVHAFLQANVSDYVDLGQAVDVITNADFKANKFESALGEAFLVMRKIMIDRQIKYGPNNISRNGVLGLIVRMGDKLSRIENDHQGSTLSDTRSEHAYNDEEPEDAWLDLANYSGPIHHMLVNNQWGLSLIRDAVEPPSENDHEQSQLLMSDAPSNLDIGHEHQ
jgi:hypothetical protein